MCDVRTVTVFCICVMYNIYDEYGQVFFLVFNETERMCSGFLSERNICMTHVPFKTMDVDIFSFL